MARASVVVLTPPKRKPGAPSRKTPEAIDAICQSIENGATRDAAARAAGVTLRTVERWAASDGSVASRLEIAEGRMITVALGVIATAAASGNWQAAAWLLERRFPQNYGRRTILAGDKNQGGTMRFTLNIGRGDGDADSPDD